MEQIVFDGCGTRPTIRNRVELLNDAGEMYAALIAALHRARHTIHLEYYIFDDDRIGRTISEVLIRRARSGVKVRVIYDLLGSWMPAWGMLRTLRKAGVEVCYFRPLRMGSLWQGINIRNHRKIAIIDDRVAFLGGINIARRYLEGNELGRWRDEHLRLEGEAVADLQQLFRRDWAAVGGGRIEESSIPVAERVGERRPTLIAWSEEGPSRNVMERVMVRLIEGARRELLLSSPYFIPTPLLLTALRRALKRGVRVELMTPARADLRLAARASEAYYGELLRLGGRISLYENGFLHTKMVAVDREVVCLGTPNLDYRSLRINWEVAAVVKDRLFGKRVVDTFWRDREHCIPLRYETWKNRPLWQRLQSRLAVLFSRWL